MSDSEQPEVATVTINGISPMGGVLAGGLNITITGTGFQDGCDVFFGVNPSSQVIVQTAMTETPPPTGGTDDPPTDDPPPGHTSTGFALTANVPPGIDPGSVTVTVVNPDGTTAAVEGGFTYVDTTPTDRAEVLGITPLAIIENTATDITIRGRNLISAYNDGLVALRGPSRAVVSTSNVRSSVDQATGIESLTVSVTVSATPALGSLERLAIQVLASRRAGATSDLVVESSRQMFTVLPEGMPVPLAYTAKLDPDNPTLVVVAGRNLDGCWLDFGQNATVHMQRCDDRLIAALVSHSGGTQSTSSISIRNANSSSIGQYSMTIESPGGGSLSGTSGFGPGTGSDPLPTGPALDLTPVPDQQIVAATDQDSRVTSLNGGTVASNFNLSAFAITILDITIILPIVNEVHLIPSFDGGGNVLNSKIPARVGRLFPVRGAGLLVALRIEITIHFKVVVIIGFYFPFEDPFDPFDPFNEFPDEFPDAFGTIIIGVITETEIFLNISSMVALVLPDGKLKVLSTFQLTLGIDFFIDFDNGHLHFDPHFVHKVTYRSINPLSNLLPCDGRFQLASDNGATVFPDPFGGVQSFYFARQAGECCLGWNFDLDLVQFAPGGPDEIVQPGFQLNLCVNALPTNELVDFIITSQPPPQGIPPTLEMNVGDSATLMVLMRPVDENGQPIPGPLQNAKDLGYGVGFYLELPDDLLDPTLLPDGDAFAVQSGDNLIRASLTSLSVDDDGEPAFTFLPGAILGFDIARFVAIGELPRVRVGGLPVSVNQPASIKITPALASMDSNGVLTETKSIKRSEPFETSPQEYVLAAKVSLPNQSTLPRTFVFKLNSLAMSPPRPLDNLGFGPERNPQQQDATQFFTGNLAQPNQQISLTISSADQLNKLILVQDAQGHHFTIHANHTEIANGTTITSFVPPGKAVFGGSNNLKLSLGLGVTENNTPVPLTNPTLDLSVENAETYEEYLRVFHEVEGILGAATANISGFANNFNNMLNSNAPNAPIAPSTTFLNTQGSNLWGFATSMVNSTLTDDRPLYWARLRAIAALRAYYKYKLNGTKLSDDTIAQFEWPSRGLDSNGLISFVNQPAGRKVIVTGFDPFGLGTKPQRSNPSGLIALHLDGNLTVTGSAPAQIRTAVFPVRYNDFDNRIVERAVDDNLDSIVLLMTTSENSDRNFYDLERWAGKRRLVITDNNNVLGGSTAFGSLVIPPNLTLSTVAAKEFLETTLPYKPAITDHDHPAAPQTLSGPQGPAMPFILDQSYLEVGGKNHPETNIATATEGYVLITNPADLPDQSKPSAQGSGGNFLSNEIFYRTALERNINQKNLASGHVHVPPLGIPPSSDERSRLLVGIGDALHRFLEDRYLLKSSGDLNFPKTPINTTSAPLTLTATNQTNHALTVASIFADPPGVFTVKTALPFSVNPNDSAPITLTFTPNSIGVRTGTINARDVSGQVLLTANLSGEGVPLPPPPQITGFTPSSGTTGDTVTITGTNFTGATIVRIGSFATSFMLVSDTEIIAFVLGPARVGRISVITPSGTATSADLFTVLVRPHGNVPL